MFGKKMIGLKIKINGKEVVVSGDDSAMSLSAVISLFGKLGEKTKSPAEPFGNIVVLGNSETAKEGICNMNTWNVSESLSVDDEIVISFEEIKDPSKPSLIQEVALDDDN